MPTAVTSSGAAITLSPSLAPSAQPLTKSLIHSLPFTSAQWGSLASFGAKAWPGTRRYYGTSGNSFVAVVEFGARVKAMAVMAGGQSGDRWSPHFADQITRYAAGQLRPVYFYPDELNGHVEERYNPGRRTAP